MKRSVTTSAGAIPKNLLQAMNCSTDKGNLQISVLVLLIRPYNQPTGRNVLQLQCKQPRQIS
jgi:hypothetical protein